MTMTTKWTLAGAAAAALIAGALAVTAVHASPGERGARMDFGQMDADGDGLVTAAELEALREARWAALDADGDGSVTREEFAAHAAARADDRAGRMFDRLDADGDGVLGRDALAAGFGRGPDAERMIGRFDTDGDGAISEAEFDEARADMRGRFGGRFGGEGRGGHGERGPRN